MGSQIVMPGPHPSSLQFLEFPFSGAHSHRPSKFNWDRPPGKKEVSLTLNCSPAVGVK